MHGVSPLDCYYGDSTKFILRVKAEEIIKTMLMSGWLRCLDAYERGGWERSKHELYEYFLRNQPVHVYDALNITPKNDYQRMKSVYYVLPWISATPYAMFESREKMMIEEAKSVGIILDKNHGLWKGFGPPSDLLVEIEARRLVGVYDSLKAKGFDYKLGVPGGQIFFMNDEYRIAPKGGWHRVSAMLALGYLEVPMVFERNTPIIHYADSLYWPGVVNGLYEREQAVRVFEKYYAGQLLCDKLERSRVS